MNLVEKLMQADIGKCKEIEKATVKSKRLAWITGDEKTVDVEIQEVDQRRMNEILAMQFDKKGDFDPSRVYDAQLLTLVEGITYPPLKDKMLQAHYKCDSPKELAETLFRGEAKMIADKIAELSGGEELEEDEVIKN